MKKIGIVRERDKVMRGMKQKETATVLMEGLKNYYNFLRPHMSLENAGKKSKHRPRAWKEPMALNHKERSNQKKKENQNIIIPIFGLRQLKI